MMEKLMDQDYFSILADWVAFSNKDLYTPADRPDLTSYGTDSTHWAVQTNQKAFATWAIVSCYPALNTNASLFSSEAIVDTALKLLRYSLETHLVGSYQCTDGKKWGNSWISALGIERMMHAIEAIDQHLTEEDRTLLQKMLVSECDWLLDHYQVVAATDNATGKNKPESNLWNGALLHRTAMMFPNLKRVNEYKAKGNIFLINSISIPQDEKNLSLIDGLSIAEMHVGPNFFDTYALHHHGYLNVGYMVICLSNIAMLHFSYKKRGLQAPAALYHHAYDLWKVIKTFIFPDGRLCRIGGDTRVRYCYCQDYALPMWYFINDVYGTQECDGFEAGWFRQVKKEVATNGDGSFLSVRGKTLCYESPLYYMRLESDRAVAFSMALHWQSKFGSPTKINETKSDEHKVEIWSDQFHGANLHRNKKRIASFVWESADKPQGLCVPIDKSDMAEWKTNLFPQIIGAGLLNKNEVVWHKEYEFSDGFLSNGFVVTKSKNLLAEGVAEEYLANQNIVFAVLPDGASVVCLQYAEANSRAYIDTIKGLNLQVPNDLFNDFQRKYAMEKNEFFAKGVSGQAETLKLNSSWVNIDDCLSVISLYGGDLQINRPANRQIEILNKKNGGGFLYCDEICCPIVQERSFYNKGEILVDTGFLLKVGETANDLRENFDSSNYGNFASGLPPKIRAVSTLGVDGKKYHILANFNTTTVELSITVKGNRNFLNLVDGQKYTTQNSLLNLSCEPNKPFLLMEIQ